MSPQRRLAASPVMPAAGEQMNRWFKSPARGVSTRRNGLLTSSLRIQRQGRRGRDPLDGDRNRTQAPVRFIPIILTAGELDRLATSEFADRSAPFELAEVR